MSFKDECDELSLVIGTIQQRLEKGQVLEYGFWKIRARAMEEQCGCTFEVARRPDNPEPSHRL